MRVVAVSGSRLDRSGDLSSQIVDPGRPRSSTPRPELILYLVAAASYIVVGFHRKEILAWWWFGAAWLVLMVWFAPPIWTLVRRTWAPRTKASTSSHRGPIAGE